MATTNGLFPPREFEVTGRGVCYTAIAGGKDVLRPPTYRMAGVAYICFTDDLSIDPMGWRLRPFDQICADPVRTAKRPKVLPHRYFKSYGWSLWVDGNLSPNCDLSDFVTRNLAQSGFNAFRHPVRTSAYDEVAKCIALSKDDPAILRLQAYRYKALGLPDDTGLSECMTLLRRHNDPRIIRMMQLWWAEISQGSRRDQVSLPFVAWQHPGLLRAFDNGLAAGSEGSGLFTRHKHLKK